MKIIAALGAALALCACTTLTPSPAVQVGVADGSLAVDTVFNGVQQAYLAAAPSLPAATKATIKGYLRQILDCPTGEVASCTGYLKLAHDAAKAGQPQTVASDVALVTQLIGEIKALLPGGPVSQLKLMDARA